MSHPRDVRFTFSSTADIDFDAVLFGLTEGLCKLYCLTVDLICTSANAFFAAVAGVAPGPAKVLFSKDPVDVWTDPGFPGPHEQIEATTTQTSGQPLPAHAQALLDKMIDATQQTPAPLAADLLKKTALVKNTEMLGLPHKLSEKTQ